MKLVPNWRKAWKWHSVQLAIVGLLGSLVAIADPSIILQAWAMLPLEMQQDAIAYRKYIAAAVFVLAIVARLRDQTKKGTDNGKISD